MLLIYIFYHPYLADNEDQKKFRQLRKDVLLHYKAENNPLKVKAARFLLGNLKERFAIEGEHYKKYSDTIERYYQNPDTLYKKLKQVDKGSYGAVLVKDINALTPGYLIDNIDRAFASLDKAGWKDEISFIDFCEFILPYRIGSEPLENWRREIFQDSIFKITGDTIFSFTDIKTAATYLTKELSRLIKFIPRTGESSLKIPDLQYSILNMLTVGTCSNLTQLSMFVCRSMAIPVAKDFTPHWSNRSLGHDWGSIITRSGSIPFNMTVRDSLGSYKIKEDIPSKVYRHSFSENSKSHAKQRGYCPFLPGFFNEPRLIDVTDLYVHTNDITIPVSFKPGKNKFAYMAVSDRENWVPIGWGTIKNGSANFTKVGENSVYLPVFASDSGIIPFNYPFILSGNGKIHFYKTDLKNLRKVELTRKFRLNPQLTLLTELMIHGKFQAAGNKDFRNAVTLYTIMESPGVYFNDVQVNVQGKYRYVRYLSRDSSKCSIAEIEFYKKDGTTPLKGEVIGTKGLKPLGNAFDGNDLTYIEADNGINKWVGLDLGKPVEISKIRFLSRNDKNTIITGNLYELFYWDNAWQSLGQQSATGKVLNYDNVPSNCLLLLKNHTEGKEEWIFAYENGKQFFW